MIRLVATDLDGTLWGPDMVVPERHARAIGELARRGVTVLAATSRRPRAVRPCFERAGLALPAVLVDGAIGVDFRTGERFHQVVFDPADALAALAIFRRAGLEPCVYVEDPDVDMVVSQTPSTCAAHLDYLGGLADVEDLVAAVLARPVYAFSVLGVARERLEPAAGLLGASGAEVMLYAEPRSPRPAPAPGTRRHHPGQTPAAGGHPPEPAHPRAARPSAASSAVRHRRTGRPRPGTARSSECGKSYRRTSGSRHPVAMTSSDQRRPQPHARSRRSGAARVPRA